ncbi:oxygen-regulated protein 1 [Boleophthalmus pectinirostris]|uniref:oxygen-regulated protein 1 n=1 Tax=Boleophthalmus pectinirostris TaxID=150288 RepID=UPI002431985C|nr:oxygen-regulated protein 1 [Boleophthalmus pectinirostris]
MSSHSQEPLAQGGSFGSGYTLPSRQLPASDPVISKRVCFYKSGDYTFSGHRMVINARTFKTFDALLDALSKKVPLAFGVRTITTPRGIHFVKGLDDLYDGGSYVCSDQKRVKPINLKELNRRQVPWNTTRPVSAKRKRQGVIIETVRKVTERVAIRTPKRLDVIKNRDPSVRRTIILQKRTAPTFDALLDYLSQILQFPVLKLYSTDGRRVDGLAALILCSGVIVAAGNEAFRLANYKFQRSSQTAQAMYVETSEASIPQRQDYNNKSSVHGKGSRKFSSSSERYIVNQINKSRYGNLDSHCIPNGPVDPETAIETCVNATVENQYPAGIIPQDEDIEKSFRVNQDGSMTVEMKVRLKIKQEEMLHWTTTLSRSSISKQTTYPMISESASSSPDCNNAMGKKHINNEGETKEANLPTETKSSVGFIEDKLSDTPEVIERKSTFRRAPTPGPKHNKKKGVKMMPHSEVQELDQYTYMKRTSDNDTTEEYHVVRHSSSRSNRPVPKPRKNTSNNGVAEVLQVEHNGFGVKETVMHIYESQGCYDACFVNEQYSGDSVPLDGSSPAVRPANDERQSSNNDCDIDSCWQPPVVDPVQHQNEEILSLSSEPLSSSCKITNKHASAIDNLAQIAPLQDNVVKENKGDKKRIAKHAESKSKPLDSFNKKPEKVIGGSKNSKKTSSDKLSNKASIGKKSSTDSVKNGQKSKLNEKMQVTKLTGDKSYIKERVTTEINTRSPTKVAPYNGHNVNVPDTKTTTNKMKKSISDILKPKKSLPVSQKTLSSKSKSVNKNLHSSKKSAEANESSAPLPSVNPSPSEIHQYVENWLEKVSPEAVPYMDEDLKSQSKVEFQIGADSEGEDKNQSNFYMKNSCTSTEDIMKPNSSFSVPVCQEGPIQSAVSMPMVREVSQDAKMKMHKSDMAINCVHNIISSPKDKLEPVIRKICTSVQSINRTSHSNPMSNIKKSTSLPDFPSQVASVFGSSCKTFLSFLSMMTLRDSLTGFAPSHGSSPRISSEAMLMMESLQKISTIDNEKKQRASLSDLQNKASSHLKEQWQHYQMKRGRSESELASSKVSEIEMDVACKNMNELIDEQLGIHEIMDELNVPADIRAEISTAIQQAICFCPVSESSVAEIEQNQSALTEEPMLKCSSESEKSNQEAVSEDIFQRETTGKDEKSARDDEEVASQEDREAENLDGSLDKTVSLKDQSSEEINKEEEKESGVAKEDLLDDILKKEITVEDCENRCKTGGDRDTVDSTVEDEQTEVITEKNDLELEEEGEDKDQFENADSNVIHGGKVVCEEVGEEHNQGSDEENYSQGEAPKSADDMIDNAGDYLGDRNESETVATIGEMNEKCEQVSVGSVPEDATSKNVLEEALYLDDENSSCDEVRSENLQDSSVKSTIKYSSEGGCVEKKCNGSHSVSELETEPGENCNLTNPVEISQELLDFVNSALQSSSLIFTYDSQGNVKVAPNLKPAEKTERGTSYDFKCLPSPNTSEITDYRSESFESGGYKTQDSLDIVTESEELNEPFPVCKHSTHKKQDISQEQGSLKRGDSKLSHETKSKGRLSSNDSGTKSSREGLSELSTASSLKADIVQAPETEQCFSSVPGNHSPDGVLIDHGRWLLKENHLIRKSPPESTGMYGHLDSTSVDTSVAEDSPAHYQPQANPLTALSSSELEEMARPPTPKCNYYNMPHGSDSDPFLDDASIKSGQKVVGDIKVEPQSEITKTWANKNGSLSSFTSVEFKLSDRKVHPEGESSAVIQARRTSSGERSVVQAHDLGETRQWRCNQYCPIL